MANKTYDEIFLKLLEKAEVTVDKSLAGLEKGVDFIIEQAPLVVQELLKYEFIKSIIYGGLGIVVMTCLVCIFRFIWKRYSKWTENDYGGHTKIFCCACQVVNVILFLVVSTNLTIPNAMTAVKIGVAPRVYLIEYCADLLKNKTTN